MTKCDICNKNCKSSEMIELDRYRITGVKYICASCERWMDKTEINFLKQIAPLMKMAIKDRKKAHNPSQKKWWMI